MIFDKVYVFTKAKMVTQISIMMTTPIQYFSVDIRCVAKQARISVISLLELKNTLICTVMNVNDWMCEKTTYVSAFVGFVAFNYF